jgi:uncharacterized membrane protein YhaH (DUF805 family)
MSAPGFASRIFAPLGRLLDFNGRSAPGDFWPYMLLLAAIYFAGFIFLISFIPYGVVAPVEAAAFLVLLVILLAFAAVVRRLHDVGWSGRWMAAYVMLNLAFFAFLLNERYQLSHGLYDPGDPRFGFYPVMALLALVGNCIALVVFIVCLLPSSAGLNKYGPDPKAGSAP